MLHYQTVHFFENKAEYEDEPVYRETKTEDYNLIDDLKNSMVVKN